MSDTLIKDGGPAFPQHSVPVYQERPHLWGMSLRDYFAGQALVGTLAGPDAGPRDKDIARRAYELADAMLAERGKGGGHVR